MRSVCFDIFCCMKKWSAQPSQKQVSTTIAMQDQVYEVADGGKEKVQSGRAKQPESGTAVVEMKPATCEPESGFSGNLWEKGMLENSTRDLSKRILQMCDC